MTVFLQVRYRTYATSHLLASASSYTCKREDIISRALPSTQTQERSYSQVLCLILASAQALTREYQICYSQAVTRESFTLSAMYVTYVRLVLIALNYKQNSYIF